MINILFYSSVFQNVENGPSKFVKLLKELNNRADVTINFLSEDILSENLSEYNLKFKAYKYLYIFNFLFKNVFIYLKIKKMLEIKKYDIIWYNNAIDGVVSSFLIKSVQHVGMINDDTSIHSSMKNYGFSFKYLRHKVFQIMERCACFTYDKIVVNSLYLKKQLISNYRVKIDKLLLLYKAIDTKNMASNVLKIDENKVIKILFVKSDFIRGGLLNLIGALNLLPYKIELSIIGPNPNFVAKAIKEIYVSSNISLKFLGNKTQKEVFDEMLVHHIFCTPSNMESLGVANMEALIHKTPVVYSNVGGIPEVMDYGNNGFAAEPNIESIASALKECITLTEVRSCKIENGYIFVKEKFSKDQMLHNFLTLSCIDISK